MWPKDKVDNEIEDLENFISQIWWIIYSNKTGLK
jgi:hypothetical protein